MNVDKVKEYHYNQLKKDPYILATLTYKEEQYKELKEENLMLKTEIRVLREVIDRFKVM